MLSRRWPGDSISALRGRFGALSNRLDSAIRALSSEAANLAAAESRIRDADIAHEAAELTKDLILRQAATSILAQANTRPQIALALIQGAGLR